MRSGGRWLGQRIGAVATTCSAGERPATDSCASIEGIRFGRNHRADLRPADNPSLPSRLGGVLSRRRAPCPAPLSSARTADGSRHPPPGVEDPRPEPITRSTNPASPAVRGGSTPPTNATLAAWGRRSGMRRQRDRVAVEGSGCASNENASSVLSIGKRTSWLRWPRRPSGRDVAVAPDGRPAPDPGGRSARRGTATATQPSTGSPSGRWVEVLASRAAEDGQALPTAAARGGRGQPQRGPENLGLPAGAGCGMVRMSVESVGPPLERRPDAPNIRGVEPRCQTLRHRTTLSGSTTATPSTCAPGRRPSPARAASARGAASGPPSKRTTGLSSTRPRTPRRPTT